MIEILTADANLPFTVALGLMAGLVVIEGLGMLFGASASDVFDSMLPDLGLDLDMDVDANLDVDADLAGPSSLFQLLSWLQLGKIPFMIWLATLLSAFSFFGFLIQSVAHGVTGSHLAPWLAGVAAFVGSLPIARVVGAGLARVLPSDETTAVSELTFVGRTAVITLGTARHGQPAQARLKDEHGQAHYVMVEPQNEFDTFVTGTPVLLLEKHGATFTALPADAQAMTPADVLSSSPVAGAAGHRVVEN